MSSYSHCQECGRKVSSAYFCRKCEGAYCTLRCLEQHIGKHAGARPQLSGSPASAPVKEFARAGVSG